MPVDGHLLASEFEPGEHISHFTTCPFAENFRRAKPKAPADDGGGPGHRPPPRNSELNLNFGEQPPRIKAILERPLEPMPVPVAVLVGRCIELARKLSARGYTKERLQRLSLEHAGLSESKNLRYCGQTPLKRFIKKMEELLSES